jgi:uncharacterized membrane protein YczE
VTTLPTRLVQLYAGLLLYALSMALFLRSNLGGMPWDVLHQGISRHTGLPMGVVVLGASLVVLLLWIPLRQRPGLGTISNVIVISLVIDPALRIIPEPASAAGRGGLLVAGLLANAVASAAYLAADFGPGPRDGLMTGLVRRTGRSVRLVKTVIEVSLVVAGALLGGVVGIGTVVYALAIGPMVQVVLPFFERGGRRAEWRSGAYPESETVPPPVPSGAAGAVEAISART